MRFTTYAGVLYDNLRKLSSVIDIGSVLPALRCVRLTATDDGRLLMTGTSLDTAVTLSMPVNVQAPGEALITFGTKLVGETTVTVRLSDLLRSIPAPSIITLTALTGKESGNVKLDYPTGECVLKSGMTPDDFPLIPDVPELDAAELVLTMPASELHNHVVALRDKMADSSDTRDMYKALNLVANGHVELQATDQRRLGAHGVSGAHVVSLPHGDTLLIPAKGVETLASLGLGRPELADETARLMATETFIFVQVGTGMTVMIRRIHGAWSASVTAHITNARSRPTQFRAVVERADLLRAVRQVKPIALATESHVTLDITPSESDEPGTLTAIANASEIGSARSAIDCHLSGDGESIKLKLPHLESALEALPAGPLAISRIAGEDAIIFRPADSNVDRVHMLMPLVDTNH